jgi:hypothetical protein
MIFVQSMDTKLKFKLKEGQTAIVTFSPLENLSPGLYVMIFDYLGNEDPKAVDLIKIMTLSPQMYAVTNKFYDHVLAKFMRPIWIQYVTYTPNANDDHFFMAVSKMLMTVATHCSILPNAGILKPMTFNEAEEYQHSILLYHSPFLLTYKHEDYKFVFHEKVTNFILQQSGLAQPPWLINVSSINKGEEDFKYDAKENRLTQLSNHTCIFTVQLPLVIRISSSEGIYYTIPLPQFKLYQNSKRSTFGLVATIDHHDGKTIGIYGKFNSFRYECWSTGLNQEGMYTATLYFLSENEKIIDIHKLE